MHTPSQLHQNPGSRRTKGFTLIELLIVITIVIVLAAIAFNISQNVRRSAIKVKDMANLRSLAAAAMAAGGDSAGRLPQIHAGASSGNSNAAPYWLASRETLESAGVFKESCYAPSKNIYGGSPEYRWWKDYQPSTPVHYCYFGGDGNTPADSWFMKGTITPPDKSEYRGAIPFDTIKQDRTKAFPRNFTDDAWYPVLWAGLCRDYTGSPRVAALMEKGEALGVNVMFLDGHTEWIPKDKMKKRYSTSSGTQVYW